MNFLYLIAIKKDGLMAGLRAGICPEGKHLVMLENSATGWLAPVKENKK